MSPHTSRFLGKVLMRYWITCPSTTRDPFEAIYSNLSSLTSKFPQRKPQGDAPPVAGGWRLEALWTSVPERPSCDLNGHSFPPQPRQPNLRCTVTFRVPNEGVGQPKKHIPFWLSLGTIRVVCYGSCPLSITRPTTIPTRCKLRSNRVTTEPSHRSGCKIKNQICDAQRQ